MPAQLSELILCDDCRDLFAHIADSHPTLADLPPAAQHVAVGIMFGGSACDHVDYTDADEAAAFQWLYQQSLRQRDIFSAALMAVLRNDRSQPYEYGEVRPSDGEKPPAGARWETPRERARAALTRVHGHIPQV